MKVGESEFNILIRHNFVVPDKLSGTSIQRIAKIPEIQILVKCFVLGKYNTIRHNFVVPDK